MIDVKSSGLLACVCSLDMFLWLRGSNTTLHYSGGCKGGLTLKQDLVSQMPCHNCKLSLVSLL